MTVLTNPNGTCFSHLCRRTFSLSSRRCRAGARWKFWLRSVTLDFFGYARCPVNQPVPPFAATGGKNPSIVVFVRSVSRELGVLPFCSGNTDSGHGVPLTDANMGAKHWHFHCNLPNPFQGSS